METIEEEYEDEMEISLASQFKISVAQLGVEQWASQVVYMTESIDGILKGLQDSTLVGVSDGSFKNKRGTDCWMIETRDGSERIVGLTEVPGQNDEHDAYRSELVCLFSLVVVVKTLTSLGEIRNAGIEVGCDVLSALRRSFWHRDEDTPSRQPHFDILSGLHGLKRNLDTTWDYRYIAGHHKDV